MVKTHTGSGNICARVIVASLWILPGNFFQQLLFCNIHVLIWFNCTRVAHLLTLAWYDPLLSMSKLHFDFKIINYLKKAMLVQTHVSAAAPHYSVVQVISSLLGGKMVPSISCDEPWYSWAAVPVQRQAKAKWLFGPSCEMIHLLGWDEASLQQHESWAMLVGLSLFLPTQRYYASHSGYFQIVDTSILTIEHSLTNL